VAIDKTENLSTKDFESELRKGNKPGNRPKYNLLLLHTHPAWDAYTSSSRGLLNLRLQLERDVKKRFAVKDNKPQLTPTFVVQWRQIAAVSTPSGGGFRSSFFQMHVPLKTFSRSLRRHMWSNWDPECVTPGPLLEY
jgi:hypothetical protein